MNQCPAKRSVLNFFLLTFTLSWLCWVPLYQVGILSEPLALVMGTFGPTTSALLLTGLRGGWDGLKTLLEKLFIWRGFNGTCSASARLPLS
jgi:hypothetical protein